MKIKRKRRFKRDTHLRKKFNICEKQYKTMLLSQKGRCYICKEKEIHNRHLAVDHCHKTKKVRGLLCRKCNSAIGQLNDDIVLLKRAIKYLSRKKVKMGPMSNKPKHKPQKLRKRWRCLVKTPKKNFSSFSAAGRFYKVHETTVRGWCGWSKRLQNKKPGFSCKKVFAGGRETKWNKK